MHVGRGTFLATAALTAILVVTPGAALAGISAHLTDPAHAFAATMQLRESSGRRTCSSADTGSTEQPPTTTELPCGVNAMLADLAGTAPGTAVHTTITITNTGTLPATADSLVIGQCTATRDLDGPAGTDLSGLCGHVDMSIADSAHPSMCIYPVSTQASCPATPTSVGTLADDDDPVLNQHSLVSLPALAAGASCDYTFTVMLDPTATNADQGLVAAQTMTWNQS